MAKKASKKNAKSGPLKPEEIFYIENNPSMSYEDIAKVLKRTVASVSKVPRETVEDIAAEEEDELEEAYEPKPTLIDGARVATENLGRNGGWIAMTGGISGKSDDISQKTTSRKGSEGVRPARREA